MVDTSVGGTVIVKVGDVIGPTFPSMFGNGGKFLTTTGGSLIWASGTGADAGLREDLAAPGGAGLIDFSNFFLSAPTAFGEAEQTVSMLAGHSGTSGQFVLTAGYHTEGDGGGGWFIWDGAGDKNHHNGGTVIDPDRTFPASWTNQTQLGAWLAAGSGGGSGVWRRITDGGEAKAVWWGVKGDYNPATGAGTDDVLPINRALSLFHTVRLPLRNILVRSLSINMALKYGGALLVGSGSGKVYEAYSGTVLWGETGDYPVIDRIGSQKASVRDFAIVSGLNTPSKCGIADRRATISQYAQFNHIENVDIDLTPDSAAYGGKGTIGWLNHAAELAEVGGANYWKANCGFAFTDEDFWGVPSHFATQGGPPSCSHLTISGQLTCHCYTPQDGFRPFRLHNSAVVKATIYTNNDAFGETPYAGSLGGLLTGLNHSHELNVYAETCETKLAVQFLEGCDIDIHGIFNGVAGMKMTSTDYTLPGGDFREVKNSVIRFQPSANGSVAPLKWIDGPTGDVFTNVRIVAPVKPVTDWLGAAPSNRRDVRYEAADWPNVLTGSATVDVGSIAPGTSASFEVTIPGLTPDEWTVAVQPASDPGEVGISAIVRVNDTARVTHSNGTAGAIDPASILYRLKGTRL